MKFGASTKGGLKFVRKPNNSDIRDPKWKQLS